VISAVVSLTLVPMLCARLVHHRAERNAAVSDLVAERGSTGVHRAATNRWLKVVLDGAVAAPDLRLVAMAHMAW